ncbi:MAG TPA: hypothetical protein VEI07_05445 [Planctomycetaceae bacterium]|nr:hypothetical protein [Planctomycetaceae bacterium]
MSPQTDRFYVLLSASQARRRLKGRGFGVKKVATAGKNRAVIFHTATDQHLEELVTVFKDVIEPWDEEVVRVVLATPAISDVELIRRFEWLDLANRNLGEVRKKARLRANNVPVPDPERPWFWWFA